MARCTQIVYTCVHGLKMPKTVTVTTRVENDLFSALKLEADKAGISVSSHVKNILMARQQTTVAKAMGDATSEAKQAQKAMLSASTTAINASQALTEIASTTTESLRKSRLSDSRRFWYGIGFAVALSLLTGAFAGLLGHIWPPNPTQIQATCPQVTESTTPEPTPTEHRRHKTRAE